MNQGVVKFFNEEKGFGFIKPDNGTKDVFVHCTNLIDQVQEEDKVSFDIEEGKKGPKAANVRLNGN